MASSTVIVEKPTQKVREKLEQAADVKKKIKQHIKEHGSLDGLIIPGVSFTKPL